MGLVLWVALAQMHVFLHKYCVDADDICSGKSGGDAIAGVWLPINKCFRLNASLPAFLFDFHCTLLHFAMYCMH